LLIHKVNLLTFLQHSCTNGASAKLVWLSSEPVTEEKSERTSVVRIEYFNLLENRAWTAVRSASKHVAYVWSNNEFEEQLMGGRFVGFSCTCCR